MKQYRKRAAAVMMITAMMAGLGSGPVYGGENRAEVDETMYVNLDYYGNTDRVNVVKSCSLNDTTSLIDYGNYQEVINMSNELQPSIGAETIEWSFPQAPQERFYFQGRLDPEQVALPWSFDLSYQLNDVPTDPAQLAGQSGLVEIHIKAIPNEAAIDYYKNNMVLLVTIPVDRSKCYSVNAAGAQLQNAGDYTAVVFMALPGEELDQTVSIGSDYFEMSGVILAMMPGTMDALEHIKDIREAKDTWRDSGDQLYDGLDQMAEAVESMKGGVDTLKSGLNSADQVREKWHQSEDAVLDGNDRTLEALTALSGQMDQMIPHLDTAKGQVEAIHTNMGNISDTLKDMQPHLEKLSVRLSRIENSSGDLSGELPEIEKTISELLELDAKLQSSEQVLITQLAEAAGTMDLISEDYYDDEISVASGSNAAYPGVPGIPGVTMDQGSLLLMLKEKAGVLDSLSSQSSTVMGSLSSLLEDLSDSAEFGSRIVDDAGNLISDVNALRDSLALYYPDVQAALDDSKTLVSKTTDALNSATGVMGIIQNTLRDSSKDLDDAARNSLNGSMELLDQSLSVLDSTASVRTAGRSMKDTLDGELDKFDTENRFLFIDPSAPKVSFTSDQNPEPKSIQVLLRTAEISSDQQTVTAPDMEIEPVAVSPFQRMIDVLIKMWNAIVEIFKNR